MLEVSHEVVEVKRYGAEGDIGIVFKGCLPRVDAESTTIINTLQ